MHPARIAELLAPVLDDANKQGLTTEDLKHISTYIDILLRWNARINLTSIRDPDEIVTRHFGESLFAARILFPNRASASSVRSVVKIALADVGSGAGFPGLPIKLWQPMLALTLIESNHKKATFLREVTRALTLTDINILTSRAESLAAAAFDIVTLRAVEDYESILPVAARLVAPAGRLALLIGSSQLPMAHSVLEQIKGFFANHRTTHPTPLSSSRILLVAERSM
jgi:16S rRNA (guanine527-N7)-methyltransferase